MLRRNKMMLPVLGAVLIAVMLVVAGCGDSTRQKKLMSAVERTLRYKCHGNIKCINIVNSIETTPNKYDAKAIFYVAEPWFFENDALPYRYDTRKYCVGITYELVDDYAFVSLASPGFREMEMDGADKKYVWKWTAELRANAAEEERLARIKAEKERKRRTEEERLARIKAEEKRKETMRQLLASMVKVEAGTFTMGSADVRNAKPHKVTITSDYYICKYEVTQALYEAVMGNNPSEFKGAKLPVENVSWDDAIKFCEKLNKLTEEERPSGYEFSLPTEAQWEFAARGGNKSKGYKYSGSDKANEVAWCSRYAGGAYEVGQLNSNELEIFDMSGNVREWCFDGIAHYPDKEVVDPAGPIWCDCRVFRGGSWFDSPRRCSVAYRDDNEPDCRYSYLGFRLVLSPVQQEQKTL